MSSKPSPAGATKAIELIDRAARLDAEIARLDAEIAELRPVATRLEAAEQERILTGRELAELLRAMDCDSPGNYGWEGRYSWLLAEVLRQARSGR